MNTLSYSISGLRLVICDKCVDVCNMNSASKIHPMATLFRTECFRSVKISQGFGEICTCITVTYRLHRHSGVNKRIFCFCVLSGGLEIIYTVRIMPTHTQRCVRDVHLSLTMHHSGPV